MFLRKQPQFNARHVLVSGVFIDPEHGITTDAIMQYGLFDYFISKINSDLSSHTLDELVATYDSELPTRSSLNCVGYLKYAWRNESPFGPGSHYELRMLNTGKKWWELDGISISNAIKTFPSCFTVPIMKITDEYFSIDPIWGHPKLEHGRTDKCFVLMPFQEPYNTIYLDHVKPAIERSGFECLRADDFYSTNSVMTDIWNGINNCRFLVAELSSRNPNVMYELGIAHALGKAVIMICQQAEDVPFDFRHLRYFKYEFTPRGCLALENSIQKAIAEIDADKQTG